jgi:hypothetical protein
MSSGSSSLASQLRILSGQTSQPDQRTRIHRPTFYFDPQTAADTDSATIYHLAKNGLQELQQLDDRFSAYESTLFSSAASELDRLGQTKQVQQALNLSLNAFLRILSPYFLIKPAHKVLEFLIRRYSVQELNVDAVLECILPYHETPLFARMLQILNLTKDNRWPFLIASQKNGKHTTHSLSFSSLIVSFSFFLRRPFGSSSSGSAL